MPRLPPGRYEAFGIRLRDKAGRLIAEAMSEWGRRGLGIVVVSASALETHGYVPLAEARRYPRFPQLAREAARYRPKQDALVVAIDSQHVVLFKLTKVRCPILRDVVVHIDLLGGGVRAVCLPLSPDAAPAAAQSSLPPNASATNGAAMIPAGGMVRTGRNERPETARASNLCEAENPKSQNSDFGLIRQYSEKPAMTSPRKRGRPHIPDTQKRRRGTLRPSRARVPVELKRKRGSMAAEQPSGDQRSTRR